MVIFITLSISKDFQIWLFVAAGQFIGHKDRIKDNMRAHNCAATPLYGLSKDHKVHGDEVGGQSTLASSLWC